MRKQTETPVEEPVSAPAGPFVPGPTRDEVRKRHHSDKTGNNEGDGAPTEVKNDGD
jgi:hypothetical protein